MHYCLVICRVSSTGHIYHRAAKRRGDKFDRSMAQLFIFISILIMTNFTQGTQKQKTEPILGTALLGKKKKQLQPVEWESVAWLTAS